MGEPVTVITLTRGRPSLVRRAIDSVMAQDYEGLIVHVVVIDECARSAAALAAVETGGGQPGMRRLRVVATTRLWGEQGAAGASRRSVYGRMGRLINSVAATATTHWITLLDDDNEYEPDHLRTVVGAANAAGAPAAHSWRRIFNADGSPYLEARFPWIDDERRAAATYRALRERGVWVAGTNILRDRAGPMIGGVFRNSVIARPCDPVQLVDHSSWLVRRDVFVRHALPESYSQDSIDRGDCPDDMLLLNLLRAGVPIVSSMNASVRYYLGGISNPRPVAAGGAEST